MLEGPLGNYLRGTDIWSGKLFHGGEGSSAEVVSKRAYIASRCMWAALLVLLPRRVVRTVSGHPDSGGVAVARVLGVRHGIQAVVDITSWPDWDGPGTRIDSLHAISALVFAVCNARWRRAALADVVVASSFALWGRSLRPETAPSPLLEYSPWKLVMETQPRENCHKIVVGVDGSHTSVGTLEWAAHQAELTGSSLEVLITWEWPVIGFGVSSLPSDYDPARDAAKSLRDLLHVVQRVYPDVVMHSSVRGGRPAPILVEAAKEADLLVVGTHGQANCRPSCSVQLARTVLITLPALLSLSGANLGQCSYVRPPLPNDGISDRHAV